VLAGLEWFEHYNCFTTYLNGWLKLSFEYDSDSYKIQVAEKTLQARAKTPEDAAATAVKAARIWALRIVDHLDEIQKVEAAKALPQSVMIPKEDQ
jgi:hypothetical protein